MPRAQTRPIVTLTLALALATSGWTHASQDTNKNKDSDTKAPGLDAGVKAPAFKLRDQTGKDVALADLLKKGPVALVFHRSADW